MEGLTVDETRNTSDKDYKYGTKQDDWEDDSDINSEYISTTDDSRQDSTGNDSGSLDNDSTKDELIINTNISPTYVGKDQVDETKRIYTRKQLLQKHNKKKNISKTRN